MAKRGPKRKPEHLKLVQGTSRPDRRAPDPPDIPDGEMEAPDWLGEDARGIWDRLAPDLRDAGILKPLYSDMFAVYCTITAQIHDMLQRRVPVTSALMREHRILAEAFYLTPGAQAGGAGPTKGKNRFAKHGRRLNPA